MNFLKRTGLRVAYWATGVLVVSLGATFSILTTVVSLLFLTFLYLDTIYILYVGIHLLLWLLGDKEEGKTLAVILVLYPSIGLGAFTGLILDAAVNGQGILAARLTRRQVILRSLIFGSLWIFFWERFTRGQLSRGQETSPIQIIEEEFYNFS